MIQLLYHHFKQAPSLSKMKELARVLPTRFHKEIFHFFKDEDKYKALVGKLMLQQFVHETGFSNQKFDEWETNAYGKPSLPNFPTFNISHTKGMIVCALAPNTNSTLGIDTEKLQPVEFEYFQSSFTKEEWKLLQTSTDQLRTFYQLWTRKESFIKADGRGLSLNPVDVVTNALSASERGKQKTWHFHPIDLHPDYETYLCLDTKEVEVKVRDFWVKK